jgi:hypothetical protein
MNYRKDKTVAKVGVYKPGYEELTGMTLSLEKKDYDSVNLAKKANGLNARVLKKGESFPPTEDQALAAVRKAA